MYNYFLNVAIENLKKCSTLFDEQKIKNKNPYYEYELYFHVNDDTKELFKHYFKNATELYKTFYFLRLLNYKLVSTDTRNLIKKSTSLINISALIPKYEESKKIFNVKDIAFIKEKVKDY